MGSLMNKGTFFFGYLSLTTVKLTVRYLFVGLIERTKQGRKRAHAISIIIKRELQANKAVHASKKIPSKTLDGQATFLL